MTIKSSSYKVVDQMKMNEPQPKVNKKESDKRKEIRSQ